jgi:hypothetical protein
MSNQPYQPYPQPYQAPPPYYLPPQSSGLATASLVFGLISWIIFPIIGSIIAVICGHAAKSEIRSSGGRITGDGQATAGLILGYLQLILGCAGVCVWLVIMGFTIAASMQTGYY